MNFRVGVFQFEPVRYNVEKNLEVIEDKLQDIQADLIVLPELSNTGYLYDSPESLKPYAEPCDGNGLFLSTLRKFAQTTSGLIIVGYAEITDGALYNSAAAISSDGVVANYRKTHLFDHEKTLYSPGDSGFLTVTHQGVSIGMMICFDWIFPESARTLALAGAQIIAHPANLVLPYCQAAMVTRSIENRVYTITANRIGQEQLGKLSLNFTGMSQITDPSGNLLFRAQKDEPGVHILDINPEVAFQKTITDRNHLFKDRRPEYYY